MPKRIRITRSVENAATMGHQDDQLCLTILPDLPGCNRCVSRQKVISLDFVQDVIYINMLQTLMTALWHIRHPKKIP